MEYLRTDTVSVGTLYRKAAKLSRGAGAYFCKHFVPAWAQGGGRLPTLPLRCSQGGLPSLPPAYPAFPDAAGGFGGFGRLPALLLVCFLSPIPPPALAERSSRREGGDFRLFYARGFAPCIPGAETGRHWLFLWKAVPEGGLVPGVAGWLCCAGARGGGLPALSPADLAVCLNFFPHPPDPLPSGKGEFQSLFCRGLRPLHPRA